MKKILLPLLAALSALGPGVVCSAQEETPAKVKLYGFIRNYMVFDTHEVSAGTQDLYFYMPKDSKMVDGVDQNQVPSFRMLALTTRLGLNVDGYRIGELKVKGNVEADFYCMSGSLATLRLRHAYMGLLWDNLVLGDLLVNVGQTWHPMAADMPHVTNLETGAPFNPFNRSPQVMFHWTVGKFTWTGGILYPMQYLQERRIQQIRHDSGGVCGRGAQERRFPGQGRRQFLLQHAALAGSRHHDRG